MDSKAQEYSPFDPTRAIKIFNLLKPKLILNTYNIHIIGTNGKGSTGRFIAQSIRENKNSVLHFTSPHIFDFRERFYKNDDIISIDELLKAHIFLQQFDFIQEASYFEYATFLALILGQSCDFLVMEAGIGGEYDSTSVINYDITIFTKIGLDHKEMLGDNIEDIALTKIKAAQGEIFTHFQEQNVLSLINNLQQICTQQTQNSNKNSIKNINYLKIDDIENTCIKEYANKYNIPLFLQENLALANIVLKYIGINLLKSKLDIRGRFEILNKNIVIDVGHNEMAALATLKETKQYFNNKEFILIYNSYREKEVEKILNIFANNVKKIIIFVIDNQRIFNIRDIKEILENLHIPYEFFNPNGLKLDELSKNLIKCKNFLDLQDNYLVFGSFSLVENFLLWFKGCYDNVL